AEGVPAIAVAPTPIPYRLAKRTLDVMTSSVGLILTSPLMLAVAAAIRMESRGNVLFRQERVGLGGRTFMLYKFRTMHATADLEYIKNRSFLVDVQIVLRTLWQILRGRQF